MAHEVETMAWTGQVPWHGLGVQFSQDADVEEVVRAAGLDWKLERWPLVADLGDGEVVKTDRYAWIRDADRQVMAVSSADWRPLQPADTIRFMKDYVEAGAAQLETAGSLRKGKIVWGLARLNHSFEAVPGDRVEGYLLVTSPNIVGVAITVRTTTVRVVCANTMVLAERGGTVQYRQNHLSDFDVAAAKRAIGEANEELRRAEQNARTLAGLKMSIEDAVLKVLKPVFAEEEDMDPYRPDTYPRVISQILESINNAPGNREVAGTGWAIMNGVTHWADHIRGHNAGTRLYRSWMGDGCRNKLEVERRLLELAA